MVPYAPNVILIVRVVRVQQQPYVLVVILDTISRTQQLFVLYIVPMDSTIVPECRFKNVMFVMLVVLGARMPQQPAHPAPQRATTCTIILVW